MHGDVQVGRHVEHRIRLDGDWQLRTLEGQVHGQGVAPADVAVQAALPALATFPIAIELHRFAGNRCPHLQGFKADRQFRARHFTVAEHQVAVDLGRKQTTRQGSAAVQVTGEGFHHRHEWPRHGQVQAGQAERAADGFAGRYGVDLCLEHQFAEPGADEIQVGVDALGGQAAVERQGLVGEVQPLRLIALLVPNP